MTVRLEPMPSPAAHRLSLSNAGQAPTVTLIALDENGVEHPTQVCGEHPLTLYLDKRELVTLMTLGTHPEDLALGWLRNQRIVGDIDDLASIQVDWETESVAVTSRSLAETGHTIWSAERAGALDAQMSRRTVTTGCGQGTVYGDLMDTLNSAQVSGTSPLRRETVHQVIDQVRGHDTLYKQAGAVHACALFTNPIAGTPQLLRFVEDVGRHNAVDAIAGWMWRQGIEGAAALFYTTGRLTSEMVIKCAQMGVPVLMSRSGLTGMGHALAERLGLTMLARCQGRHFLVFTGAHRMQVSHTP
jgi:FdhD protein